MHYSEVSACFLNNIVTLEKKVTDFHMAKVGIVWALPASSDLFCCVCINTPDGEVNKYFPP